MKYIIIGAKHRTVHKLNFLGIKYEISEEDNLYNGKSSMNIYVWSKQKLKWYWLLFKTMHMIILQSNQIKTIVITNVCYNNLGTF